MAEEKPTEPSISLDDTSALRVLLRTVHGLTIVSTPPALEAIVDADDDYAG